MLARLRRLRDQRRQHGRKRPRALETSLHLLGRAHPRPADVAVSAPALALEEARRLADALVRADPLGERRAARPQPDDAGARIRLVYSQRLLAAPLVVVADQLELVGRLTAAELVHVEGVGDVQQHQHRQAAVHRRRQVSARRREEQGGGARESGEKYREIHVAAADSQ